VQLQAVTCGENQVIKGVNVREKAFHRLLVEDVNRLSTYISSDGLDGFLNSFCFTGDDHDVGSLRCRLFGDCQTDPRRPADDDHPLILETVFSWH
jgi:hypothetical protein